MSDGDIKPPSDDRMTDESLWVRNQKALAENQRNLLKALNELEKRVEKLERAESKQALEAVQAAADDQQARVDAYLAGIGSGPSTTA